MIVPLRCHACENFGYGRAVTLGEVVGGAPAFFEFCLLHLPLLFVLYAIIEFLFFCYVKLLVLRLV